MQGLGGNAELMGFSFLEQEHERVGCRVTETARMCQDKGGCFIPSRHAIPDAVLTEAVSWLDYIGVKTEHLRSVRSAASVSTAIKDALQDQMLLVAQEAGEVPHQGRCERLACDQDHSGSRQQGYGALPRKARNPCSPVRRPCPAAFRVC